MTVTGQPLCSSLYATLPHAVASLFISTVSKSMQYSDKLRVTSPPHSLHGLISMAEVPGHSLGPDIWLLIQRRQWGWLGHTLWMECSQMVRRVFDASSTQSQPHYPLGQFALIMMSLPIPLSITVDYGITTVISLPIQHLTAPYKGSL